MDRLKVKFFTLEEANSALPEVKEILLRFDDQKNDLLHTIIEVDYLKRKIGFNGSRRKIAKKIMEIASFRDKIADLHQKTMEKGIIIRDLEEGLVDFPTIINNDLGYFSWTPEQKEVSYWHGIDEPDLKEIDGRITLLHTPPEKGMASEN